MVYRAIMRFAWAAHLARNNGEALARIVCIIHMNHPNYLYAFVSVLLRPGVPSWWVCLLHGPRVKFSVSDWFLFARFIVFDCCVLIIIIHSRNGRIPFCFVDLNRISMIVLMWCFWCTHLYRVFFLSSSKYFDYNPFILLRFITIFWTRLLLIFYL